MPYRRLLVMACVSMVAATSVVVLSDATVASAATCASTVPSDFNGDGIADAAITERSGAVHVIYGTRSGLTAGPSGTALDDQLFAGDKFDDVAVGDFNADGCADLAVGDRFATVAGVEDAGEVRVYWGSPSGLTGSTFISEDMAAGGALDDDNQFGISLAVGDFNGDGITDLAVGAPNETGNDTHSAVAVFPGSRQLTFDSGGRLFEPGDGIVPNSEDPEICFGWQLAAGDFNGDGRSDLVIGQFGQPDACGANVIVLRGSGTNAMLTGAGAQVWGLDSPGILGSPAIGDGFGSALATGDFAGNGRIDLAIGIPSAEVDGAINAGAVSVLYSTGAGGLSSAGNQLWTQDSPGIPGVSEAGDGFGQALAAADFGGDGRTDLAVGAPGDSVDGAGGAGAVDIIPGGPTGLTATGSSLWDQATAGVPGTPESGDGFGSPLTPLRITSTARSDLLIGVAGESVSPTADAGEVELLPSAPTTTGLTGTGSQAFNDGTTGIKGALCACYFGWSTS